MSKLSKRHCGPSSPGAARPFAGMPQVHPHAAGVDSGAHEIMPVCPWATINSSCVPLARTRRILTPWRTGAATATSSQSPWNPQSSGFPCVRPAKPVPRLSEQRPGD